MPWGHFLLDEYFDDNLNVKVDFHDVRLRLVVPDDTRTSEYVVIGCDFPEGPAWVRLGANTSYESEHYMYGKFFGQNPTKFDYYKEMDDIVFITKHGAEGTISLGWLSHKRAGPNMLRFSIYDPFKNRQVIFQHKVIKWKPEYDAKYDFFGKDFFRNAVDKLAYSCMIERTGFSIKDML